MNDVDGLIRAIDANRRDVRAVCSRLREDARQPALWIDVGRRGVRGYALARAGLGTVSTLFRLTRLPLLVGTAVRALPLVGAGLGAFRLARR